MGVLALAVLLGIVFAGPDRVAAVLHPLADFVAHHFVTNDLPQPAGTDTADPAHAVGTACSVQGDRAQSVLDGSQIECLPLPAAGNGLHWQHPAPAASASKTGH